MNHIAQGILVLVLGLSAVPAAAASHDKSGTPAEQYKALVKEYDDTMAIFANVKTDEERKTIAERVRQFPRRFLEFAETNPKDPVAVDALIHAVWVVNGTAFPASGPDTPAGQALALLQRDHVGSEKLGPLCQWISFGFHENYETFLRAVLESNPHQDVQGLACVSLAHLLHNRLQRVDLIKDQPDSVERYRRLFGKDFIEQLERQDRAQAIQKIETLYELAAEKYADVKTPDGGTVGQKAKSELFTIRHLAIGREAPEIEGVDQDGAQFKLSDYRGKVVLLYFWDEF
jgi:hypothetical protein